MSIQNSPNPNIRLEIILLEATWSDQSTIPTKEIKPASSPKEIPKSEAKTSPEPSEAPKTTSKPPTIKDTDDLWKSVIASLKGKHNTLYGVARMANAEISNDRIKLVFKHDFHKRRCSEPRNKTILQDTLSSLSGKTFEIEYMTDSSITDPKVESTKPKSSDTLDTITNIFGGGEVLDD